MNENGLRDGVLTLAGIAVLLAMLRMSAEIVAPILLALFIAIIAHSPAEWLKQRGIPSIWSVIIVVFAVVVILVLGASMLGSTFVQFNEVLPSYQSRMDELTNRLSTWLAAKGINIEDVGIFDAVDPSAVMGFANNLVAGIGDTLSNAFLIIFIVLFMLSEASGFPRKMAAMDSSGKNLQYIADIVQSVNRYVSAKTVVSLVTGVLIWIGLELVGLDFAPLWGFLAFLLNFVPNIGSVLAAVPAVLLAMLLLDPTSILIVIAIYMGVNTVIGNVLEPTIMGKRVGLSVLMVFLSLVFWGWMFGAVGMLLSVPLSMVVKFAARANPRTQWLAVLLEPAPAEAPDDRGLEGKKRTTGIDYDR